MPNPAYDNAFTFRESGDTDRAFYYFNRAKDVFTKNGDSLGVGKCLLNMAIISTDKGDYFGGQELSLNAIRFFNPANPAQFFFIHSNYNNLGIASYKLKDYSNSLKFYAQALSYSKDSADTRLYLNNQAKVYQELKEYTKAIAIYKKVLSGVSKNPKEYARALSNLAMAEWQNNSLYNPIPLLHKARLMREENKDLWGMNSSYATLLEYYERSSPATALSYAKKMYEVARELSSPDDELFALQNIIELSDAEQGRAYFSMFTKKQDSLLSVRNAAKNQFALIRYESEKNKADNLILQKDNQAKSYQVVLLISGIILTAVSAILIYRKRKQKLALDAKNAIKESQLRTSKKVHDVVANGLYRLMTEFENQAEVNRVEMLDQMEDLYEKSRDISYDKPIDEEKPFHELISELLGSFAGENTRILIAGNEDVLWQKVCPATRYELIQILQELMINMKKHSRADQVVLRFERLDNHILINYQDNGIGIKNKLTFNNGLRNTGNRIETINGAINFDTTMEKGLKIELSFPVA
ncbi:ATP-binding protein [Pedobacter yonginense]|uniref:histidine kinase n=1 Tax=Pedobacter yonginense TaxID=651869 RepID=A0A317EUN5_9SPHI|nr:ATP-binding protein [Pedobacter yonginense]